MTVFDPERGLVYVASLGDSPTMQYRRALGKFALVWRTVDQDCADEGEIRRMEAVHAAHGDASPAVVEVVRGGVRTGVYRVGDDPNGAAIIVPDVAAA